jgi:hypothetical protein
VKGSLLTGISLKQFILLLIVITAEACHYSEKGKLPSGELLGKIIYDTSIINRDSTDSWASECLSEFNRKALIEKIFEEIYNGKLIPYDYFTAEKISPDKIKTMEAEKVFSRKDISKIRFEEKWIWDDERVEMRKQVNSITLSYDVFDNVGKLRGQKPIFKIIFR